jgi:large subunit ribosomal protein L24e
LLSLRKCTFCGKDIIPGTGIQLVRNDGSVMYFCSNKCRLNSQKLKRDPRKLKWTLKHVKGGKGI